jgi:tRNA (guanosine-2'-O-)-methyltransferase
MTPERFARLKQALRRRQHDFAVLADGVHKTHNLSAILRTCDAVGVPRLHAVGLGRGVLNHHMIAGGSGRWVEAVRHPTTAAAFAAFRAAGMQILAAHAGPGARDFREIDYTTPTALVVGAERKGPTRYAIEHVDAHIAIPMQGLVESLNVSVAAAVILFEAERQRRERGLYERPPPDDEAYAATLFEWAYPDIAARCRELGCGYPPLDEQGLITCNPFESS